MSDERVALLASSNEHKLRELARVLPGWRIGLLPPTTFPPESGDTYHANAVAKARSGRTVGDPDSWVLGEDSGIEVDALGGRPGLASNRWAAPGEDPVDKLLHELREVPHGPRTARYVCALVAVSPGGAELHGHGILRGRVAAERRGWEGFGYDPVFVPEGESRTVAELGDDWKARHSHRARAAAALLAELGGATPDPEPRPAPLRGARGPGAS